MQSGESSPPTLVRLQISRRLPDCSAQTIFHSGRRKEGTIIGCARQQRRRRRFDVHNAQPERKRAEKKKTSKKSAVTASGRASEDQSRRPADPWLLSQWTRLFAARTMPLHNPMVQCHSAASKAELRKGTWSKLSERNAVILRLNFPS